MRHVIKRLFRAMGFQITKYTPAIHPAQSRRTDRLAEHKTATGIYYLPVDAEGDVIAATIIADQIFDKEIVNAARKHIKPETTVLDVGSNFGQMSILFSDCVGNSGKVHAFEADDFVFSVLAKNIEANGKAKKIAAHYGAVHDRSGETLYFPVQDFKRFSSYGSYGIDYLNQQGREVTTIAIDDILFDSPVSFMKIDIQGGDLYALRGAVRTIMKYRMPIIFEYEWAFEDELKLNFQEYVDFVASINYKFSKVFGGQSYLILPD